MFDTVLDAFAEATGCDRSALRAVVGAVPSSDRLSPTELVDRIAAQEKAAHALQATQARDLAAFGAARHRDDVAAGVPEGLRGAPPASRSRKR